MRIVFTIALSISLLFCGMIGVFAMVPGFDTEKLQEDEATDFLENIEFTILENEPSKKSIDCFDVDEKGLVAVGFSNFNTKTICIYTNQGTYQYGYTFECSGSFGVELKDNILNIYFVRSDIAISINQNGDVIGVERIKNTIENDSYWRESVYSTTKKVGDNTYTIKSDLGLLNIFATSYSQVVITDANGVENVIYDVNSQQLINILLVLIGSVLFVGVCLTVVIKDLIKRKSLKS